MTDQKKHGDKIKRERVDPGSGQLVVGEARWVDGGTRRELLRQAETRFLCFHKKIVSISEQLRLTTRAL